jgi:hypothetical protein
MFKRHSEYRELAVSLVGIEGDGRTEESTGIIALIIRVATVPWTHGTCYPGLIQPRRIARASLDG